MVKVRVMKTGNSGSRCFKMIRDVEQLGPGMSMKTAAAFLIFRFPFVVCI